MLRTIKYVLFFILKQAYAAWQNRSSLPYLLWPKKELSNTSHATYSEKSRSKVCIYSVYKPAIGALLQSSIEELMRHGFDIVVVSNSPETAEFSEWLRDVGVSSFIERPNLGRDFGAYKAGFTYLESQDLLTEYDELLLINDTIFFPVVESQKFWSALSASPLDAVGAFESYSPQRHIQSFFILCKNRIHTSDEFRNYWKHYTVWNSRIHAISKGEIGFSQMLIKTGYKVGALLNQEACFSALAEGHTAESYLTALSTGNQVELGKSDFQRLSIALERSNPSHSACVFAIRNCEIPILKKDLVYRGTLSLLDITILLRSVNSRLPATEILEIYKLKGLPSNRTLLERIATLAGAK